MGKEETIKETKSRQNENLIARMEEKEWSMSYEEQLREMGEKWRLNIREELDTFYNCLKGGCSRVGVSLFSQITNDGMREVCLKLHQERFGLGSSRTKIHRKGCKALEQVAQGRGEVILPTSVPKMCGYDT